MPFLAASYDPYSFEELGQLIYQKSREGIIYLPAGVDLGRDAEERAKRAIKEAEEEIEQMRESHGHLFDWIGILAAEFFDSRNLSIFVNSR